MIPGEPAKQSPCRHRGFFRAFPGEQNRGCAEVLLQPDTVGGFTEDTTVFLHGPHENQLTGMKSRLLRKPMAACTWASVSF